MNPTLAINGGIPVRTKPWLDGCTVGEEEKKEIMRVMDSGYLSLFIGAPSGNHPFDFLGGPEIKALEDFGKEVIGVEYAISVNSATSGLFAAIGALGIGFGDEVIVSPYTMSACAMAPLIYGAIPVFADVELETGCLDAVSIRERITPRTKAILVVHQFGFPADMDAICSLAKEHGLKVIEDCAQAWGATYKGKNVGTFGDIGVFSFNVHKTIQVGEGGLCVTRDANVARRLQYIRNHGEAVVEAKMESDLTNLVGFNYRMTEPIAAMARAQLRKLGALNQERLHLVAMLNEGLMKYECLLPLSVGDRGKATYYLYPVRYLAEKFGNLQRSEFVRMLNAEGMAFSEGYIKPLYLLPIFQKKAAFKHGYPWSAKENSSSNPDYSDGSCPNAEILFFKQMITTQYIRPPQTTEDIRDILKAIEKVVVACNSSTSSISA